MGLFLPNCDHRKKSANKITTTMGKKNKTPVNKRAKGNFKLFLTVMAAITVLLCHHAIAISGLANVNGNESVIPSRIPQKVSTTTKDKLQKTPQEEEPPADPVNSLEPLGWMEMCAEKYDYIPEIYTHALYNETYWPAPTCKYRSVDLEGDYYSKNQTLADKRNEMTIRLVQWAAQKVRKHESEGGFACESHATGHDPPMMHPDEFEMLVKTLIRLKPRTYLELGTGRSTSFYPLLASGQAYAIDNYPPWCEQVNTDPVVSCMVNQQKRLKLLCAAPVHKDGTPIKLKNLGLPLKNSTAEEIQIYANQYLSALDHFTEKDEVHRFDAVLIDGRLRVASALKILNYIDKNSVVFIHDFFSRQTRHYHPVLNYYTVLGYARNLIVLRKKDQSQLPIGWETAWKIFANMKTHTPL